MKARPQIRLNFVTDEASAMALTAERVRSGDYAGYQPLYGFEFKGGNTWFGLHCTKYAMARTRELVFGWPCVGDTGSGAPVVDLINMDSHDVYVAIKLAEHIHRTGGL